MERQVIAKSVVPLAYDSNLPDVATTKDRKAASSKSKTGEALEKPKYVVSEQEFNKLRDLIAVERAIEIIHSVDGCPRCPTSFAELWKQAGNDQARVVGAMATLATMLADSSAGFHQPVDENDKRMNILTEFAGEQFFSLHLCTEGHTGCKPAGPQSSLQHQESTDHGD